MTMITEIDTDDDGNQGSTPRDTRNGFKWS